MKPLALDHIHLYCADPEVSARFWTGILGGVEALRNENVQGQTRIFVAFDTSLVVLSPFPPGSPGPGSLPPATDGAFGTGFGVAHVGLRVDDVRSAVRELEAAGVEILTPTTVEDSGLVYAYAAAPDGVVIELTEYH